MDWWLFDKFTFYLYVGIGYILTFVFRFAGKVALVRSVGDWSTVALFWIYGVWNLADFVGIDEALGFASELRLKGVLFAEISIVFHVVLSHLAWAFAGITDRNLASDIIWILLRFYFILSFSLFILLFLVLIIDEKALFLIFYNEIKIGLLKIVCWMFWYKCDLKGDAKLVQDIFDLVLLALDWASILDQLL